MSPRRIFGTLLIGLITFVVVSAVVFFVLSNFGQSLFGMHDPVRASIHFGLMWGLIAAPVASIWWWLRRRDPSSEDMA